jgi:hypothetical protein
VKSLSTRAALILFAAALVPGAAPRAHAQDGASMQELSIEWARGRYGSPVICELEGNPVQGMRRLHITPGPHHVRPPVAKVIFVGMEADQASRCFTQLEKSVPDILGSLQLRFPGPERRDTSLRDFKHTLRRENGLEFDIAAGVLSLRIVGSNDEGVASERRVDFRGGKARFVEVAPGSDAERMLAAIKSPRKLDLHIAARDGTTIRLPIFLAEGR